MVLGAQLIGIIFGLGVLYLTFLYFKRSEFTRNEWGLWTLLGTLFILLSIFPEFLDPIIVKFQFARTLDFLIILGFMFLIAATFYTYVVTRQTQRKLESLVRRLAIEKAKKK
ncbi:DUF2304 domain-containing protein [Candidatus Woesearchaeota archaeon]|nr:DUF2304 domain-containing protein [Candidatus Woesearchaeota archaeon]